MNSWSCSWYILVFFEYSNSISGSLPCVPRERAERREERWPRHPADRHLDQRGAVELDRLAHAEGAGQLQECGFRERRREGPAPGLVEVARDVAEGVVVEDDGDDGDLVEHGRRQTLPVVHEAAVAGEGDHRGVG